VYSEIIDEATKGWERRGSAAAGSEHVATLYNTNNLTAGVTAAERLLARQKARLRRTTCRHSAHARLTQHGLSRANREADALREFKLAVPVLMARSRETDDDDPTTSAAREQRASGGGDMSHCFRAWDRRQVSTPRPRVSG
jgi:hypothetical protein